MSSQKAAKTGMSTYRDHYRSPVQKKSTAPAQAKLVGESKNTKKQQDYRHPAPCLTRADLTELKAFSAPPQLVKVVCECLGILMGLPDLRWKTIKSMLGDVELLLKKLATLDGSKITPEQACAIREIITKNGPLDEGKIACVSKASVGLFKYVMTAVEHCESNSGSTGK